LLDWDYADALGYTGEGVYVAVLDSGVSDHPDLRGRIAAFRDFTSEKRTGSTHYYDDNGHGTHVCGTIAGSGVLSGGKYKGIASGARLVCGKVLSKNGSGSLRSLVRAMKWIEGLCLDYPIRVLNISIEIESEDSIDSGDWAEFKGQLETLWDMGLIIVAAAGNRGPADMSLSPIGECGVCICVGCNDADYRGNGGRLCMEYSGRGPGHRIIKKPDIVAPGTDIVSCGYNYTKKPYVAKSGTSMSAPIVSGACALCLHKYPDISNVELRRHLLISAVDLGQNWSVQGAGMINIKRLLMQNI
jgi:serine protease AprX